MNAVPNDRGLDLLAAHCASLDPDAATARERLEEAIGADLAGKLVFARSGRRGSDESPLPLRARAVFAA